MTEEDEEKQFMLQKNGGYALTFQRIRTWYSDCSREMCMHIFGITETKSTCPSTTMNLLVC